MAINRRQFAQGSAAALASTTSLSWAMSAVGKPQGVSPLMKEAGALYAESIVIDMISSEELNDEGLEFIKNSGVTCFSPTLGVRRPSDPGGTYMLEAFPMDAAIEDCVRWREFIATHGSTLIAAHTTADIKRAKREGKIAVLFNFQNTPIADQLENLDMFYGLGVRSMQLTYNERNLLGDGCTERTNAGLSDFGVAAVERMNDLGILVDTSHSGYQTTLDGIKFSRRPPIFSHTNCAALNEHPRNKSDEQIRALAKEGGVMGLTTVNVMVKRDRPVTMEHFLDHIDHVVDLVGIDHVAFGSDVGMRGWPTDPAGKEEFLTVLYGPQLFKSSYRFRYPLATEGINDEQKWKYVTAGLLERGYRDSDIKKILGGNWLRVFAEVID